MQQMLHADAEREQKRLDAESAKSKAEFQLQQQRLAAEAEERKLKERQLALWEQQLAFQKEQSNQLKEQSNQLKEAVAESKEVLATLQDFVRGGMPGTHRQLQDAGTSRLMPRQRALTNGAGHQDSRRSRAAEHAVQPDVPGHIIPAAARTSAPARAVPPSAQTGTRTTDAAATTGATHELWPIGDADPVMNATMERILQDDCEMDEGSDDDEMDPRLAAELAAQVQQLILANANDADPPVGGAQTYVLSGR